MSSWQPQSDAPGARSRRPRALSWVVRVATFVLVCTALPTASARAQQAENATQPRGPQDTPTPRLLTERDLLERWLAAGAELSALRAEVGAARFRVIQAGVLPNPEVSLGSSFLVRGVPPDGELNLGPEISWELPMPAKIRARRRVAMQELRVSELHVATVVWQRAHEVREAAIERAFAYAALELLRQSRAELDAALELLRARGALGVEAPYDILRLEAYASALDAASQRAQAQLAEVEGRLLALVSVPGLVAAPVERDGLTRYTVVDDVEALTAFALDHRPDLQALRHAARARDLEAQQYRAEARPSPVVAVGAWFTRRENSSNVAVGLALPLPLFDRQRGRIGEANALAGGLRASADALEVRIRHEIGATLRRRRLIMAALESLQTGPLAAATDLVRRAHAAYGEGEFGIVELLDAQRTVWELRSQMLELELDLARATASVVHATGGGSDATAAGGP